MGRNDILYNMRQILSAMTVVAKETVPNVKYPLTVSIVAIVEGGGCLVESNITIDKGSRPFFVMFFLPVVFLFPALGCGFKNLHPLQSYFFLFSLFYVFLSLFFACVFLLCKLCPAICVDMFNLNSIIGGGMCSSMHCVKNCFAEA